MSSQHWQWQDDAKKEIKKCNPQIWYEKHMWTHSLIQKLCIETVNKCSNNSWKNAELTEYDSAEGKTNNSNILTCDTTYSGCIYEDIEGKEESSFTEWICDCPNALDDFWKSRKENIEDVATYTEQVYMCQICHFENIKFVWEVLMQHFS